MKRLLPVLLCITALVAFAVWAPNMGAYESYHDPNQSGAGYCATCHPGHVGRGDLHDSVHVPLITNNCNLCHTGSGRNNPLTMWSRDIAPDTPEKLDEFGCTGCHGRDYGETIESNNFDNGSDIFDIIGKPKMSGYGLIQRHINSGETECSDCHFFNESQIHPENVSPPYYGRSDVNVNDPCADNLDNDGDGLYDSADPDCLVECTEDIHCDDGLFCNGAETCNLDTSECVFGTPPVCDDGVDCTDDSCDEVTKACTNTPNNGLCNDGLFCNGAETCDQVNGCQSGPVPCNPATETCVEPDTCEPIVTGCTSDADCADNVTCTVDVCDTTTGECSNTPNNGICDNGLFCDGAETCDQVNDCQSGSVPCDPATQTCNEDSNTCEDIVNGCASDEECDDSNICNGMETCNNVTGECVSGQPLVCEDDGQFCNGTETCVPTDGCVSTGEPCSVGETCVEANDLCVAPPVILDIARLHVTKRVSLRRVKPVKIKLVVKNNSLSNSNGASATIVGVQNGEEVYAEDMDVGFISEGGRFTLAFPPYTPEYTGDIVWSATIQNDVPAAAVADDTASATTKVVP